MKESQKNDGAEQELQASERMTIKYKILIVGVVACAIFAVSLLYYAKVSVQKTEAPAVMQASADAGQETKNAANEAELKNTIVVYITGEVLNPGLYRLPSKSRVSDLVQSAGGLLPTADVNKVNLAKLLKDGMHIVVTAGNSAVSVAAVATPAGEVRDKAGNGGLVNINTAGQSELDSLPGIGAERAEKIIKYRQENGLFKSIDEIQNVSGVGKATFDKMRDKITI